MYDNMKVYGPYTRKDGRQVVILKTPGSSTAHKTVCYPKYLVECQLQRYLTKDETVDHIDGDFTNNDLKNLRVVTRSEHCRSHVKVVKESTRRCVICGKQFTTKDSTRITCGSQSCRGRCAHIDGYNQGNSFERNNTKEYIDLRDTISHITSVV